MSSDAGQESLGDRRNFYAHSSMCASGVPRAAIEELADGDAFHVLAHDRRQALWRVRGLGNAPLPLFAAADARSGTRTSEGPEPMLMLRLTEGREVIEDYRSIELSLRVPPLRFLRDHLRRRGIVTCVDLDRIKDGVHVQVACIILV